MASDTIAQTDYIAGYATAYCLHGKTASGEYTRDGICAGSSAYQGKVIILWQRLPDGEVGEFIGIYECLDTGGTKGLKNGTVIDVWKDSKDECQEFMNRIYEDDCHGKVFIQVIDKEDLNNEYEEYLDRKRASDCWRDYRLGINLLCYEGQNEAGNGERT